MRRGGVMEERFRDVAMEQLISSSDSLASSLHLPLFS